MKSSIFFIGLLVSFWHEMVFGFGGSRTPIPPTPTGLCVTPYEYQGASAVTKETNTGPDGRFTLYRPTNMTENHPILTWGNGTGATPENYDGLLRHFASHGFVVIASNSTQTGTGVEMINGAKWMVAQNAVTGSKFFGKLRTVSVGAVGHSQGGQGTVNAGKDPLVSATAPIEPAYARGAAALNHGPMFLTAGSSDTIVPVFRVNDTYNDSAVYTIYGILSGATHFEPVNSGGKFKGYLVAWFKLQLAMEAKAADVFTHGSCGIFSDTRWKVQEKNIE